ncbi:hypothetical protein G3576_15580 [Roseomonas stagni]|uniref:Lipoprotein n=1 Tax=Falsiroseomonas algicola TaxID=2716930 RepID=A0A6M1LNR1_9PROT|nr:hypothetical protein [Falsiroseomonas algicola]NGM21444.1 hypothetical protein [Falsiroseomonas algicola]
MTRFLPAIAIAITLAACAPPQTQFIASQRSAVELRAMQARVIPADADTAMRAVIATLHDLGYRITRVEPEARTVSATRQTALRMAVVVQPRDQGSSTVRANASIVAAFQESQVDSPEFYRRNFFEPLEATFGRALAALPATDASPDAPRPVAELNTLREREAAGRASAPVTATQAPPAAGAPAR